MATNICNCLADVPTGPTLASTCGGSSFLLFMGILEFFIRSQCDLQDPCGRANSRFRSEPDEEYDFIVVGSGSAGSVVASRLSEIPQWKVLLVEAGNDEPVGTRIPSMFQTFLGSDIDWKYKTEPEKMACLSSEDQKCSWPRAKVLGGNSVVNGMMYLRGNPEDFDDWEDMGNPGWSFKDVLPYFLKSENNLNLESEWNIDPKLHAKGGLLPVSKFPYNPPMSYDILKASEQLGFSVHDLNGRNTTGFMIAQMTQRNGVRWSSARSFLRPARDRQNLHILLNSTVTKVLVHPHTKSVYGVEVSDQFGRVRKILSKKEVIVSGGAVNSPQLLLLSGIGPKEDLEKVNVRPIHNLPGVGKNLHNHVSYPTNFFINEKDTNPLNWATATQYLLSRDGLMAGTGLSDVTGKFSSSYAKGPNEPDIQLFFGGYLADCSRTGQVDELLSNNSRSISMSPAVLQPKSRGYLTLASNDPLAPPRIFANYLSEDPDIKVLIEGIKYAIKLSETPALQKYGMTLDKSVAKGCESFSFGSDEYWECAVRQNTYPENHQAGSCKMGPARDPLAVVDHELRVHGIRGLRVMDTSIMPKLTSGNTHAPAVMIAEKGTDMIKKAWIAKDRRDFNLVKHIYRSLGSLLF